MDIEFSIDNKDFRAGKLDAFKQFHLSRKIAPVIPSLIPLFMQISKDSDLTKDLDLLAELLQPFADGIADLSDESSEYIMATCLSVVKMKQGETWVPIWNNSGKVCMFDDIDLGMMMRICMQVIQDSLGSFIQGLLMSQQASPMKEVN
jgi:hypothetical protein